MRDDTLQYMHNPEAAADPIRPDTQTEIVSKESWVRGEIMILYLRVEVFLNCTQSSMTLMSLTIYIMAGVDTSFASCDEKEGIINPSRSVEQLW